MPRCIEHFSHVQKRDSCLLERRTQRRKGESGVHAAVVEIMRITVGVIGILTGHRDIAIPPAVGLDQPADGTQLVRHPCGSGVHGGRVDGFKPEPGKQDVLLHDDIIDCGTLQREIQLCIKPGKRIVSRGTVDQIVLQRCKKAAVKNVFGGV